MGRWAVAVACVALLALTACDDTSNAKAHGGCPWMTDAEASKALGARVAFDPRFGHVRLVSICRFGRPNGGRPSLEVHYETSRRRYDANYDIVRHNPTVPVAEISPRARWLVFETAAVGGALFVPIEGSHKSVDVSATGVPDPRAAAVRTARVVIRNLGAEAKRT